MKGNQVGKNGIPRDFKGILTCMLVGLQQHDLNMYSFSSGNLIDSVKDSQSYASVLVAAIPEPISTVPSSLSTRR